ncbi:hypothetical protein J1614_009204 [Plenodomus biglobosus]|nr:hypothetical protein J1614_009204 [Plenodomus biglobosus]
MSGLQEFLRRLKTLLTTTGQLVCGIDLDISLTSDGLSAKIPTSKSNGHVEGSSVPHAIESLPQRADVVILGPASPSDRVAAFTTELMTALQSHGAKGRAVRWGPQILEDLAGKHVISLLELESSYMEDLSAGDSDLVRSVNLTSSSLFWITGFSQPTASIAIGLFRSIRRENAGQWLQLLHMIPEAVDDGAGARMTARIINSSTKETEFLVERDGLVKISTIFPEKALNTQVGSFMSGQTHVLPLKDVGFPIKLAIEKPGLLDTLYFEKHSGLSVSLKDNEVEIQVAASGMK